MENILIISIPSSDYHKNFSSSLIHGFIETVRKTCDIYGIKRFNRDQEDFNSILSSNKKPFDILISMGFTCLTPELCEFYKKHKIKIILFQDDIHGKNDSDFRKKKKLIDVADILLIPYYRNFLSIEEYKSSHQKAINFPWFAPSSCFKYDKNWDDRNNNILITGCMADVYSLRRNIRELSKTNKTIDVLDHPGYKHRRRKHKIIGDKYYDYVSNYKCSVATSADSPLDYLLSKYFEIPACGCVGLFEEIEDLKNIGLEKNIHYIPITNNNYEETIRYVYKNVDEFKTMSSRCKKLMKNHHTDIHRAIQLINIVRDI